MTIFFQFWKLLDPKEKLQVIALFICMLISACLELLGIGLIIPVIALLAKPELMDQNKYLKLFKAFVNPSSDKNFVILLGILIIALFIFKNLFLAMQAYSQARFVLGKGARISSKLFDTYIHASYKFHLDNNSGTLMSKLGIGSNICASVLMPAMIVATESLVLLSILVMLLTLSPIVTISLIVFCGIMFAIFHFPLQNLNLSIGKKYYLNQIESGKITLQGLHAVKDSKIMNVEDFFTEMYSRFQNRNKNLQSLLIFITNSPRFFIEAFVVCTGMTTILILLNSGKELSSILMILSLFAVSLVRIMPSLSRIQYNLSNIKQQQASFEFVANDLKNIEREDKSEKIADIKFREKIEVKNLVFSYGEKSPKIFDGFNLEIPYKSSIAFVGPTGCGKTTLVDIILGLLKPNSGEILVDGVNIEMNLPAWQKRLVMSRNSFFFSMIQSKQM